MKHNKSHKRGQNIKRGNGSLFARLLHAGATFTGENKPLDIDRMLKEMD